MDVKIQEMEAILDFVDETEKRQKQIYQAKTISLHHPFTDWF